MRTIYIVTLLSKLDSENPPVFQAAFSELGAAQDSIKVTYSQMPGAIWYDMDADGHQSVLYRVWDADGKTSDREIGKIRVEPIHRFGVHL